MLATIQDVPFVTSKVVLGVLVQDALREVVLRTLSQKDYC